MNDEMRYAELQKKHNLTELELVYVKTHLEYGFACEGPSMSYGLTLDCADATKELEVITTKSRIAALDNIVSNILEPSEEWLQENCYHNCPTQYSPGPCSIRETAEDGIDYICVGCVEFEDKLDKLM